MQIIFEALCESHDDQRRLLEALTGTRERMSAAVKLEPERYAAAEERHFYVPLTAYDRTQEKARHGIAEHHDIDELVETRREIEYSSPG